MEKAHDRLKKYGTIIATVLATAGIFAVANKNRVEMENAPKNPTELTTDVPNDVIDFETVSPTQTFQVDTISDAEIIKQVDAGTYSGSMGYYDFEKNTTITKYFKGAENQPSQDEIEATIVHENAHAVYANTYGEPIGRVNPDQAYCLQFALEFNGYIHETIYQLNESARRDSIVGMHHYSNEAFGDSLYMGLMDKYISGNDNDMKEFLTAMTNSVFENMHNSMVNSELYTQQLLDAARDCSDVIGYPEDIKRENFELAVQNAFTIRTIDAEGNPQIINLYDYLSDENKELLETVAPQHQKEVERITAEKAELIAENTAMRLSEWDKEAEKIAREENCSKEEVLQDFQFDFETEARTFIFPQSPQYQQHDAEHHVSEVMTVPEYDNSLHTTLGSETGNYASADVISDVASEDNSLAFLNVREKMQNLHQLKTEMAQAENTVVDVAGSRPQMFASRTVTTAYRRPEEITYKTEKDRS